MIIVQGCVGAGKSTISKILSARLGIPMYAEPVEDNPYLELFYENPSQYSFPMQVWLLHARFKQAWEAEHSTDEYIMDASMYTTDLFSALHFRSGFMSKEDYLKNYERISDTFKSMLNPPTLAIYLRCSTETAVQRIMKRGRQSELKIPISYWYQLNTANEKWYQEYQGSQKVAIDTDNLNLEDEEQVTRLCELVSIMLNDCK